MIHYYFIYTAVFTVLILSPMRVQAQEWKNKMLKEVNDERKKANAPALCYNEKLNKAARIYADDMIKTDAWGHIGSDGSEPADRVDRTGYRWSGVGENIAWGQESVGDVMDDWMSSPGHKRNILNPQFEHFGAVWKNDYWVQVFGSAKSNSESCMNTQSGPSPSPPTNSKSSTCRDMGSYNYLRRNFCNGRANKKDARFARFWQIREDVLSIKCKGKKCEPWECCFKGPKSTCTNTGPNGMTSGGFTSKMCGKDKKLKPKWALKWSKCTGEGGRKCWKWNCCDPR